MEKKRLLGVIAASLLILGVHQTVYADGPAGPASDQAAIILGTEQMSGPAGPAAETAGGEGSEVQTAEQESGQNAAGDVQQHSDTQPVMTSEGLIASGGRFLDPNQPMVALTFDDGPYAPVGNRIMDCLELYNGRATFFVVGNRIPAYQDEILRMKNNGHEIANHTQEHRYLTGLNAAQVQAQVEACNQTIAAATGAAPALVRLPGGLYNDTVLANIHQPIIMWNIDTRDWKTRNAASTVQAILSQVRDGDIILMHELYGATADAVEAVIPALTEQGYQLVTVSELAAFRGGMAPGVIYSAFRR